MMTKTIMYLTVIALLALSGCSAPERPVKVQRIVHRLDRNSPEYREVVLQLYESWRLAEDEKYYGLTDSGD